MKTEDTKLYLFETTYKHGNKEVRAVAGIKETGISAIIEKLAYIGEWFSIGFLFYLNSIFIHSRLFSIFVFICGIVMLQSIGIKKKITTKEEFLEKVNLVLEDKDE